VELYLLSPNTPSWRGVQLKKAQGQLKTCVGKPEGNKTPGIVRCRCEDNIESDLKGTRHKDVDCIHSAQDKVQWWDLVHTVMKLGNS
jgi:hypothetical protein